MLSKPLALQSVRTHRPSLWQCEWEGFKSYCLCTVTKKPPLHLSVSTDKAIAILIFSVKWDLSTIIYSFPVFVCVGCFWQQILVGAEELWLLFSLCQNTQEPPRTQNTEQHLVCELSRGRHTRGKMLTFVNIFTTYSTSALYHRHILHKVWKLTGMKSPHEGREFIQLNYNTYFWVLRYKCMRKGKPCKMSGVSAAVGRSLCASVCVCVLYETSVYISGRMWW